MNPFKKRSKSNGGRLRRKGNGRGLSGSPEIISSAELAFSLPSENAFRTSLLMPKMADRFSLLRLDEPGQGRKHADGENLEPPNGHSGMHMRDLSILEEGDEEEDELPVRPWGRRERLGSNDVIPDGMSKEEFIRIRAQEGNSLFSGKQRTFKFRTEDVIDRQYSTSSISSKSPHSPGFEYHPPSSHTSTTSSILFSSAKPPQTSSKASTVLGFDFGLADSKPAPQAPPSPTSTVYEVIDSPTVPDYLLAEDDTTTVDLVRDVLRRPPTAQTQAPPPNFHEAQYPTLRRKRSKDSWRTNTETIFKVDDGDNDSLFWDENGVFAYYGQNGNVNGNGIDEEEQLVMGEQWVRTLHMGEQNSRAPPKSPKPLRSPRPTNALSHNSNGSKPAIAKTPRAPRQSLFDEMPPSTAALNVKTNVTILKSPDTFAPKPVVTHTGTARVGADSPILSSNPYKVSHSDEYRSAVGYEGYTGNEKVSSPKQPRQRSSSDHSARSPIGPENRKPINTDARYITPEMPSMSIFPNTPPPSVSPSQSAFGKPHAPFIPDQSMTPPSTSNPERKPPTANVLKALRDRSISEPTLQHMTATVPTIPIVRMGGDKLEQIRNDRRKTRRGRSPPTERRPRKAMLDDEPDDIGAATPGPFTRRKTSPPAVATRGEPRRRETTAGSVLFDENLRDRAPSPSSNLFVAQGYTARLPSPHLMSDNPYQPVGQPQSRHRRKVSRQDIDPVTTHSSPAVLNQWDGHPKRRINGAIDPAW